MRADHDAELVRERDRVADGDFVPRVIPAGDVRRGDKGEKLPVFGEPRRSAALAEVGVEVYRVTGTAEPALAGRAAATACDERRGVLRGGVSTPRSRLRIRPGRL
jgi:hypothetical protein